MKSSFIVVGFLSCLTLISCQANKAVVSGEDAKNKSYQVADIPDFPERINSFRRHSGFSYPNRSDGASARYRDKNATNTFIDVFLYPVPSEWNTVRHKDLVIGHYEAIKKDFFDAENFGVYRDVSIVGEHLLKRKDTGSIIVKGSFSYLNNNMESYSIVYLTEGDDIFFKARVVAPDNPAHRTSRMFDEFIVELLEDISDGDISVLQYSATNMTKDFL